MATMLTGCRSTDGKVSAIVLEIEELRAELALKKAQNALEKARLGGNRGAGSPSEWTAEELSAHLAQGRAEIAYERVKVRSIGKLEEDTNVFTVFVPSWALKTPQGKASGKAAEVAEATPVVEQPRSVPTATDEIMESRETDVSAGEIFSLEADNVQLSFAEAAQGSVQSSIAPCAGIESVAYREEPLVDELLQILSEAVEGMVVSEEAEEAQGSCKCSGTARLIVELACAKYE